MVVVPKHVGGASVVGSVWAGVGRRFGRGNTPTYVERRAWEIAGTTSPPSLAAILHCFLPKVLAVIFVLTYSRSFYIVILSHSPRLFLYCSIL